MRSILPSLLHFSGGTDSSYLLYAAKACGANVHAYYVSTPFQPQFELDDAKLLAESLHADMTVLPFDVLTDKVVKSNPKDRCYYCKNQVFGGILKAAKEDGFTEIMDGTNASDDAGDRPGMRALKEMKVLSPLRLSGITKTALREYSRNAGLFTWNKPAYACLATRVPSGISIEASVLKDVSGQKNPSLILDSVTSASACTRILLPVIQTPTRRGVRSSSSPRT